MTEKEKKDAEFIAKIATINIGGSKKKESQEAAPTCKDCGKPIKIVGAVAVGPFPFPFPLPQQPRPKQEETAFAA